MILVMLCGVGAFAQEESQEQLREAFAEGLAALLDSFDPDRDMMEAGATVQGNPVYTAKLTGTADEEEPWADLSVLVPSAEPGTFRLQVNPHEIYLAAGETLIGIDTDDVPAILEGLRDLVTSFAQEQYGDQPAIDWETCFEMLGQLAQRVLLKNVSFKSDESGIPLTCKVTGEALLRDFADAMEEILADEKYLPAIDSLLGIIGKLSGEEVPTADQLKEMWPQAKQELAEAETDFSASVSLTADPLFTHADLAVDFGVPGDRYLMAWTWRNDRNGKIALTGKLTERILRSAEEGTRDYDIDIAFGAVRRGADTDWSLKIDYPSRPFKAEISGAHAETDDGMIGKVTAKVSSWHPMRSFEASLDYAAAENVLSAALQYYPYRYSPTTVSVLIDEQRLDLSVNVRSSGKRFALSLIGDEDGKPASCRLETKEFALNYDGEKVIYKQNGVTITCVGAFVSDHEYVVTLTPEGTEDTRPAYIRAAYEGEEGNWSFTVRLIDPEGGEAAVFTAGCSPTEGISSLIRDEEDLLMLTPETVLSLVEGLLEQAFSQQQ